MAGELHLLLAMRGDYVDASLSAESWQMGVRFRASNAGADPVGDLPTDIHPGATSINRDETNWTITGNWELQGPQASRINPDDWLNDQVAAAAAAFIGNARVSNQVRLRRLDVYPIGPDGRAVPAPPYAQGSPISLVWKSGSEPKGAASSNMLPLQIACVLSWHTQQVGRRGRGRIYVPSLGNAAMTAAGGWASSVPGDLASAGSQFLTDCTYLGSPTVAVFIQPIVTGAPYTKYAVINKVSCGNVPDTQRRRRRSLTETYADVAVPHP